MPLLGDGVGELFKSPMMRAMMIQQGVQGAGNALMSLGAAHRGQGFRPPQAGGMGNMAQMAHMSSALQRAAIEKAKFEKEKEADARFLGMLGVGGPGGTGGPGGPPPPGTGGPGGPGMLAPGGAAAAGGSPFGPRVDAEEMEIARRMAMTHGPEAARDFLAKAMTAEPESWKSMGGGVMYHPERGFAKIPGWTRSGGTSVRVDLGGLAQKERMKDAVNRHGELTNNVTIPAVVFAEAANRLGKQLEAGGGTTIGAAGALARVGESVASQAKAISDASGVSMDVGDYDFGALGDIAKLSARTKSGFLALAAVKAKSDNPGRVTEGDLQRALGEIGANTGSIAQAQAMLNESASRAVRVADRTVSASQNLFSGVPVKPPPTATELLKKAGIEIPSGEFSPLDLSQGVGAPAAETGPAGKGEWPAVGTVEDGYEYRGGDPAAPDSWRKVD